MKDKTIALLESRLGDQLAELVAKRGGIPIRAPALSELPDVEPGMIRRLIEDWSVQPVKLAIFQTGVGTRALFEATDALGLTPRFLDLLAGCIVVVRGPKPTAALRGRKVRIDYSAEEPYTTTEVLKAIEGIGLAGERVLVQRYGEANTTLDGVLEQRGATVIEIPTYRWALPRDTAPIERLIDALDRSEVDAVVFTSASQVHNLFAVAQRSGRTDSVRKALNAALVASIGPVCSSALASVGVRVSLEPRPPKLGPLIAALDEALQGRD
jgi:uroporphyrinogen-III synthase